MSSPIAVELLPSGSSQSLPLNAPDEYLFDLIAKFAMLNGLSDDAVVAALGVSPRQCIWYIYQQIQAKTTGDDRLSLEYSFVQAVATVLLNRNRQVGAVDVARLQPRVGQIQSIQRTVFRHGDTILIAWTGYGKSIVLQTVSVIMKGMVTLQLCPLVRLGQDQVDMISQIDGARPILISDETRKVSIPFTT